MAFLGIVIAILGVILIFLGVVGAAKDVFFKRDRGFVGVEPKIIELALKVLLQVLKGPPWLIMVVIGAILVFGGRQLYVGGWPFA